ncbi:hypothetical protein JKG47_01180 [Acidithiobacillus sp. MC6.1]|nr:hypothetical protein [Acidithiobacillus sp. MC6.1]
MQPQDANPAFRVCVRNNQGQDWYVGAASLDTAKTIAKTSRTTDNHMVCIEEKGHRILRWDRNKVVGENHWRKVDVYAFETLGTIATVIRARHK